MIKRQINLPNWGSHRLLQGFYEAPIASARRVASALFDARTLIVFCVAFLVYFFTAAPTIYNLDSAELTTAAATGGIVRATGYPLYLILGNLWARLPLGDVGFRLNLFSAFNGALTLALADRILQRWGVRFWAALGAVGLLATSTFFWGMALIAEVYTLHTALMAGLILALLRWKEQPSLGRLALVGLLGGLSMGNHAATVLLVPGALLFVAVSAPLRRTLEWRGLSLTALACLAGLSVYLYLPWRYAAQPAFNYAGVYSAGLAFKPVDLATWQGFWWLISGQAFAGQMFAYRGGELWGEALRFGAQLARSFFALGIVPGLLGLYWMAKRKTGEALMLVLMFAASAIFYIGYRVIDKETMFLPAYLVWALWVGYGYQGLLDWAGQAQPRSTGLWSRRFLEAALAGLVLLAAAWNWPLVDLSNDRSARILGETILHEVEPGAIIFGWWDTVPIVEYLQLVEGQRPDVQAVNRFLISTEDLNRALKANAGVKPVYIDSRPLNLPRNLKTEKEGPIYQIIPADLP